VNLQEKLIAIHRALDRARLPHAFGGAIALAYWTLDPRGTSDIDVNVFVPKAAYERVVRALPAEVTWTEDDLAKLERDGQARLWWGESPVDLFLDYAPVHADAARHHRLARFYGKDVPMLGPVELAVFKAVFDRTKDWADIEAMIAAETLDVDAVREKVREMLGDDERLARLDEAERRGKRSTVAG
jgi:hypothetical protein